MADIQPRMSYYGRVIDNQTGEEILSSTDALENNVWYYGKCNGLEGGESSYIVELDIWNNEPAFNAGMREIQCLDAVNCRLTVWPNEECKPIYDNALFNLQDPFLYFNNVSDNYKENFKGAKYNNMFTDVTGTSNPDREGIIQGIGDHAKIQTKIILPKNSDIPTDRFNFTIAFYYDYS
jgi:hypothetical protein